MLVMDCGALKIGLDNLTPESRRIGVIRAFCVAGFGLLPAQDLHRGDDGGIVSDLEKSLFRAQGKKHDL